MKTVSTAFTTAWMNRANLITIRQVKYKRRYWNGAAFVYEADWQTLRMKDFSQIGTLTQQLDTVKKNEFKVSNITLSLNNRDGRWFPDCSTSVFSVDAVATIGYQPYKTLFQVLAGYELADGTEELLTLFTGLLVDYNLNSATDSIEYTINGYEQKLLKADAQLVSTAFTEEALTPAPDGVITDFYTTSKGVGRITSVRANTVVKFEGAHYRVSQLNEYGLGACISFEVAPAEGVSLNASGRTWDTLAKIEDLIGELCDQAGVTAGERAIDSVLFSNGVNAYQRVNSQAEWAAGSSLVNITSDLVPGSIRKKWFSDGNVYTHPANPIQTWRARMSQSTGWAICWFYVYDQWTPYNSYSLVFRGSITLERTRNDGSTIASYGTVLASVPAGMHEYTIQRNNATNEFKVWVDGVLKLTVTSADMTGGYPRALGPNVYTGDITKEANSGFVSSDLAGTPAFDGSSSAVYESAEFDLLAVPTEWGNLDTIESLNGGTVAYATNVRTGSGAWDGWVDISGSKQILSALKQKLKMRVTIVQAANALVSPNVEEVLANFTTTTIFVALANFASMTVYTAIQKLAKLCNYEWGFEGDGQFFFRSKSCSVTPVIVLDQKDIQSVSSYKPGWPDVINAGQMSYGSSGQYYKEYNSDTLPETAPTSKDIYGEAIQSDNASDFLLGFDADLATGAVQLIHDDNCVARRKIKLICRLIPHLDISDTIQATFIQDPLKKEYVFGDPLQKFGSGQFGQASSDIILNGKILKVLGHAQRFAEQISELTTEEII